MNDKLVAVGGSITSTIPNFNWLSNWKVHPSQPPKVYHKLLSQSQGIHTLNKQIHYNCHYWDSNHGSTDYKASVPVYMYGPTEDFSAWSIIITILLLPPGDTSNVVHVSYLWHQHALTQLQCTKPSSLFDWWVIGAQKPQIPPLPPKIVLDRPTTWYIPHNPLITYPKEPSRSILLLLALKKHAQYNGHHVDSNLGLLITKQAWQCIKVKRGPPLFGLYYYIPSLHETHPCILPWHQHALTQHQCTNRHHYPIWVSLPGRRNLRSHSCHQKL